MIPPGDPPRPLIRLTLLGEAGLHDGAQEITRILAQPRRFALLVRLAVGVPGAFLRRDHLLGVFWPGSDESHARASLRQALRYLRSGLGPDVIVGRGDDEVGVDPTRLSCDVVELDRALDEGRDEAVLALYRGPLLPGFLIADAPDFERWLSTERRRIRAAVVDAAVRLSTAAEDAGEMEPASEFIRRALEIDPVNEAVARRRIDLLDRLGDRGSAITVFRALTRRLREDLDVAPAPETMALMERIRSRGSLDRKATVDTGLGAGDPTGGTRRPDRQRIVAMRFRNETGRDELDLLEAMVADWITQGLSELSDVTVVPPILSAPPPSSDDTPSGPGGERARTARIVEMTGAGTVIQGAFYPDGEQIRFRVRIMDTVKDRLLTSPDDVRHSPDDPTGAVETVSRAVNTALAPLLSPRAVHVRGGTRPPSFAAYRAYMEGLDRFIRGRWRPALDAFRCAWEIEPDYALPRIVQAISHWNLGELEEAESVAREAAGMRHRLGTFESAVLDMVRAWLAGDWLGALEAARIQAGLAPGSIPHFQVAEEARRLNRPEEARAVLSRLDPEAGELHGWIYYWIELTTAQHLLGDHDGELASARRARILHPDDPVAMLLEVRALAARGEVDALETVIDAAAVLPTGAVEGGRPPRTGDLLREAGLELAAHGQGEAAQTFLERSATWYDQRVTDRSPPDLRRDHARSLYHAGRLDEAERLFRTLAESDEPEVSPVGFHHGQLQGHMDQGYLALLAAHRGDTDETEAWHRSLAEASGPFLYGSHWFWLACLDAITDRPDRAAARLRRALAEGLPHEIFLHADPHLRRLTGHPRFDAMMRPRG